MPTLPSFRESGKCPHCLVHFSEAWKSYELGTETPPPTWWYLRQAKCPACGYFIFVLRKTMAESGGGANENCRYNGMAEGGCENNAIARGARASRE